MTIFVLLLFSFCHVTLLSETKTSSAGKGIFFYPPEKKEAGNILRLDGQWEFYWNTFIEPDKNKRTNVPDHEIINVPGSWNRSTDHPAHGFATFRLDIRGLDSGKIYCLYVPEMISAYRLYANGIQIGGNGKVGESEEVSSPRFIPRLATFYPVGDRAEILIHVSNFNYRNSGIWRSLFMGNPMDVSRYRDLHIIIQVGLAAVLLAIALFHIGIYINRREEKAEFIFGLVCLTFLIRILCTGEQILTLLIPAIPWELARKLEYIPFYATAPLLAKFMNLLFPGESSRGFNRLYVCLSLFYGLLVWVLPVRINNYLVTYAEGMMILGIFYATWIQIRALIARREEATLIAVAYIIFALAVVNDILYASQILPSMYLSPFGFVIFICIQSQMLINRYTRSFFQRDLLARSRDQFREASITDSLTGLFNVRYLHLVLERAIADSFKKKGAFSLIMADVDNFKDFNDTWGHRQGDEVLKKMGAIIRGSAREKDSPCRYGGEEFAVVLPDTPLDEALEVAERIRCRFEKGVETDERMRGITVSVGVAQHRISETADELIERADQALYSAKHQGKNRVVRAQTSTIEPVPGSMKPV